MRALVLGGTGFVGSSLVDGLLAAGHKVRVLARNAEQFRSPLPGVDYRLANFSDIPTLVEAVEDVDVVFHLISTTVPSTSNRAPLYDIESNLIGTVRLLEILRERPGCRLIYLSSGGTVYGVPQQVPMTEEHPLQPICSYGVVKVAVENYLHMFHELHGLDYLVVRPSNPYGPRQGHFGVQGIIGTFLHKVLRGESCQVWGDGSLVRDFIYVDDLAGLCVAAAESDRVGVYNAGSGQGYSIKEILAAIESAVGRPLDIDWQQGRSFDVPRVVLDISKTMDHFSWQPATDLASGIALTWAQLVRAQEDR